MSVRVQVILEDDELAAIRTRARQDRSSVSAWMREAARERLAATERPRLTSSKELRAFFLASDAQETDAEREPDWDEHLETMDRSRRKGRGKS